MAQANEPNTTNLSAFTRRMLLRGAAVIPIAGVIPAAAAAGGDPIFAAIERHKMLEKAFSEAVTSADLLPGDRESNHDQLEAARELAAHASDEAAIALLDTAPVTIGGVVALLRYASSYVEAGNEWPTLMQYDPEVYGETWYSGLCARMADRIEALSGGA